MSDDSTGRILAAIEQLRSDTTAEITKLRVDLMGRMDRLQDALTGIRDDIATNYGASDAAQRANENTRAEVRTLGETVSILVRQVRQLDAKVRELRGDP